MRKLIKGNLVAEQVNGYWTCNLKPVERILNKIAARVYSTARPADGFPDYIAFRKGIELLRPDEIIDTDELPTNWDVEY